MEKFKRCTMEKKLKNLSISKMFPSKINFNVNVDSRLSFILLPYISFSLLFKEKSQLIEERAFAFRLKLRQFIMSFMQKKRKKYEYIYYYLFFLPFLFWKYAQQ